MGHIGLIMSYMSRIGPIGWSPLNGSHLADLAAQPSLQHVQVFVNLAQDDLGVEFQAASRRRCDFREAQADDFEAFLHELIQRGGGRVNSVIAAMVGDNHKNLADKAKRKAWRKPTACLKAVHSSAGIRQPFTRRRDGTKEQMVVCRPSPDSDGFPYRGASRCREIHLGARARPPLYPIDELRARSIQNEYPLLLC